jgi:ectoine hydroxylase-related dioxygenase (phytanoyl-CoA dioxygenase family)
VGEQSVLKKRGPYLVATDSGAAPAASQHLEQLGYAVLPAVFSDQQVPALAAQLNEFYATSAPEDRSGGKRSAAEDNDFRYQMFNHSALAQQALAHPLILQTIEPLLGGDCHVIANTCWRNAPHKKSQHGGGFWHIDSGPHVPRPAGIDWDERIPYPIFAIGAHIYLQDCPLECGPTGVIPGSHKSGSAPPVNEFDNVALTWQGQHVVPMEAKAGDVALFVSDAWHRRLPCTQGDFGRFFLQVHYARRDIAQRVETTAQVNHVSAEAEARITSKRERALLGLHEPLFYDG